MDLLSKIAESIEPVGNAKIAAAVVYKNEIVSIGNNKKKSHPFQKKFSKNSESIFLHAETDAIKGALKKIDLEHLNKCKLYIARVKFTDRGRKNIISGLAKPCEGCQKAIATFNIKRVCYSCDDEGFDFL